MQPLRVLQQPPCGPRVLAPISRGAGRRREADSPPDFTARRLRGRVQRSAPLFTGCGSPRPASDFPEPSCLPCPRKEPVTVRGEQGRGCALHHTVRRTAASACWCLPGISHCSPAASSDRGPGPPAPPWPAVQRPSFPRRSRGTRSGPGLPVRPSWRGFPQGSRVRGPLSCRRRVSAGQDVSAEST